MDELWQRYRTFWTPVLIGLGVFLVGLIAVNIASDDPQQARDRVTERQSSLRRKIEPREQDIKAIQRNAELLRGRLSTWAVRLDQAGGEDPLEVAVSNALQAALLRGSTPDELRAAIAGDSETLVAFAGDAVAAGRALAQYEQIRIDRLTLLRTGDPNVGFSRLLNDVWSELRVRANRRDVDITADVLGFATVKSVSRATLTQRLLNLALVSRVVDIGIRSGLSSIDEIRFENRANPEGPDVFLREWPVTISVKGDMASLRPILDFLTDPDDPVPLLNATLSQPRRGTPLEGQVQLTVTATSTLVRADATLDLAAEEE